MGITINMLTDISTSAAITSSRTSILLHMLTIKFNFFCWHIPSVLCGDELIAPEFTSLAQSSSLHRLSYMATPLISCSNFKRSKKKLCARRVQHIHTEMSRLTSKGTYFIFILLLASTLLPTFICGHV